MDTAGELLATVRVGERGEQMVNVTFWGVRGSTPCACEANARYGGNTSCVVLEAPGQNPIIFDIGTGLRFYGDSIAGEVPFNAMVLLTHLHWDHVQGLPFFTPIHQSEAWLEICGRNDGSTIQEAFDGFMVPPYFPVSYRDLAGDISFRDVVDTEFDYGRAHITVRDVPHTSATNGYRVEIDGIVVVYISDHQQPLATHDVAPSVLELCRDADLVIHDAQYEPHEFAVKSDWGHCTVDYAVNVAAQAGAKRLALFHHDPTHDDEIMDRLQSEAQQAAAGTSVIEVIAAAERLTVSLSAATTNA